MTNLERIRRMTADELAELLVHNEPEMDYDGDELYNANDNFVSPCSSLGFWDRNDCVEETIDWLMEEADNE